MYMDRKTLFFKRSLLSNFMNRFNEIIKFPASYFVDISKLILKFIQKAKRHRIAITILKKKNKVGVLTLPDIKIQ